MILTDSLYAVLLQLTCVEAMIKGYHINVYFVNAAALIFIKSSAAYRYASFKR